MRKKGTLANIILQGKAQMVWTCGEKKGTLANIILQGKAQMVWTCGENEGNPGKHHLAG